MANCFKNVCQNCGLVQLTLIEADKTCWVWCPEFKSSATGIVIGEEINVLKLVDEEVKRDIEKLKYDIVSIQSNFKYLSDPIHIEAFDYDLSGASPDQMKVQHIFQNVQNLNKILGFKVQNLRIQNLLQKQVIQIGRILLELLNYGTAWKNIIVKDRKTKQKHYHIIWSANWRLAFSCNNT